MRGIRWIAICVAITFLFPATAAAAPAQAGKAFIPPVDGEITKPFKMLANSFGPGSHRGVDFGVPPETPVKASGPGEVTFVGPVGGEGPFITISHEKGLETTYSYLSSTDVVKGQRVAQSDVIGKSGEGHPGESPALHFGAKKDGKYIDPELLFLDFSDITELIRMMRLEVRSSSSPRLALGKSGAGDSGPGGFGEGLKAPAAFGPRAPAAFGPRTPAVVGPGGAGPVVVAPPGSWRGPSFKSPTGQTQPPKPPIGPPMGDRLRIPKSRDPRVIADWWSGLTEEERMLLVTAHPRTIGGLGGVSAVDRNKANQQALNQEIEDLRRQVAAARADFERIKSGKAEGPLGSYGKAAELKKAASRIGSINKRLRSAEHLLDQVLRADDKAADGIDQGDVLLLDFDTAFAGGEGRAIVALGDPDSADNIGIVVPGITNRLDNFEKTLSKAANLRETVFRRMGAPVSDRTSTIAWLGYDTPESVADAVDPGEAMAGAKYLKEFVGSLRRLREGESGAEHYPNPLISIFAHSYGSPTSALAAIRGMKVDNLAFLGAPGAIAPNAKLLFGAKNVWAGRSWDDGIKLATISPFLGRDPMEPSFGAKYIPTGLKRLGHSDYFMLRTKSLDNLANILTGRYDAVN